MKKNLLTVLKLCIAIVFVTISMNTFAQRIQFKGVVKDENQATVPGVSIIIKGSRTGTSTQSDGTFTISAEKGQTLVISSIGFVSQQIVLGSQTTLNIDLRNDANALAEVVVTALGIKKDVRKVGYSVTELKGDDVNKVRSANPLNALAGKVAGLSIGASTEMLGRPEIVLRGSKDLLYVVDGVPINSDTWNISPDDIESYTILKGPNAAALYGSRGINGAIVITSKHGTKDAKGWSIDFNSTNMFDTGFIALPESQYEYGRGTGFKYAYGNVLYDNGQRLPEWGPRFEGQQIQQYDSSWDPITQTRGTTPWLARGKKNFENFIQTGLTSTNNISVAASGDKYDMRLSYSHLYQKGIFPNTKLNGDNLNLNLGYNVNKRLKIEGNLNLSVQYTPNIPDVNYGPNSYTYMFKVYGSSDYDIRDLEDIYKGPQGVPNLTQYSAEYGRLNSAWFMAKEWLRSHQKTDVYGYLKATYKFNDDLTLSARSQVTTWNQARTEKVPPSTNLNDYIAWYKFGWYGDYREDNRNVLENNTDVLLSYNKKVSDWNFSALAGASMRSFKYTSNWATTKGLAIPKLYSLSNTLAPSLNYTWGSAMQVYSGYYSADIGYKNYFNINTTGRVDNLSTLPKGNNTFFYPSASISTVLTDFAKLPEFVSFLKLRASVADVKGGLTSATIGSAYMGVTGKTLNAGLLNYGSELYTSYDGPTYANQNSYSINSYYNGLPAANYSDVIANTTLKPYNRLSYEGGFDLKFFKNRLGIDATYFRTINGPQIYALDIAPSTGFKQHNINGITTLNQGFEISLNAAVIKNPGGFNWDINANWSTYKETLKAIYGDEKVLNLNGHGYKVGERLDAYYGRTLVRDGNGNIVHTSAGLIYQAPSGDNQNGFLGNLNPDYSIGISNRFSYKSWGLNFQWDGRIGGKIFDFTYAQTMNGGTGIETASGAFGDSRLAEWNSLKNTGTAVPAYVGQGVVITSGTPKFDKGQITNLNELTFAPNTKAVTTQSYITGSNGLYGNTEYFMVDRSFAKLREVSLSYSLPEKLLKRSFLKAATIALVGRNLLYFAKRKDMDMDSYASGFNATDRSANGGKGNVGLQSSSTRTIGFNLTLSL
ncbi:TonB-linked SusC/RagA family outer membrane protein [Pedobacter cryoconitis]|uniref:TonB-linked SusC/RagA family outer membrane protein n=1 Tax=Pedobacter cryoconitis TaxID=188932 RepID=A0A7W8ZI28_9SPHI|nr:SusC/RagA family TonB-linked outer membrane protein [Pedobacter cryoconitis]MBB5634441.1 TonB-linked SusC/RagA family outer membrane protein [Pedobacter cryoconitis]